MRPFDRTFLGETLLPQWLRALVRELPSGGAEAPAAPFAVMPLLAELIAITDAIAQGKEAPFSHDRASLNADIQQALTALGPQATSAGRVAIAEFRKNNLAKLLDQSSGARKIRAAAQALTRDLSSPDGRVAAWRDCVDAFTNGHDAGECESRLRHLSTVFESAGFDWPERANELSQSISLSLMFVLPGEDPTSVSVEERLEAAEEVVREEITPSADTIVWVAFANAAVESFMVTTGPLEFYDSRIWSAVATGSWPGNPGWVQPPELADPYAATFLGGLPADEFVMVRISLQNAPLAEVRERARDLAQATVELAGADDASEWALLNGAAAFTNSWWGSAGFSDPRVTHLSLPALMSPVSSRLRDVDDGLVGRIAVGEPGARDLIADLRWFKNTVALRDLEQRLALLVSLVERLLIPAAVTGDKWRGAAQHYFEYLLAFDRVQQSIWDAVFYGVSRARRGQNLPPAVQKLTTELVRIKGHNRIDVDLRRGINEVATILPHVEPGSIEERMLKEVQTHMADGPSAAAWIEATRVGIEAELARALRERNAATHGTRTVQAVVASVDPLLTKLVGRLIGAQHLCVEQQLELVDELEQWRLARIQRVAQLRAGGAPDALLID